MGWICPECGEPVTGDLCPHCGKSRRVQGPASAGSYLGLIGFRSTAGWKPAGSAMLATVAIVAFFMNRVVFYVVDAAMLIAFGPSILLSGRLLFARWLRR